MASIRKDTALTARTCRHQPPVPISAYTTSSQAKSILSFPVPTVCLPAPAYVTKADIQLDGRNSSTAFALSSGTLGAALAGALSVPIPGPSAATPSHHNDHIPCIAVSYGVVTRPVTQRITDLAHDIAVDVCRRLWDDWGWDGPGKRVQVYTMNVALVEEVLLPGQSKVCWTKMWRNSYGRLFKATEL